MAYFETVKVTGANGQSQVPTTAQLTDADGVPLAVATYGTPPEDIPALGVNAFVTNPVSIQGSLGAAVDAPVDAQAPENAIQVGAQNPDSQLVALQTDPSGNLKVNVEAVSSPIAIEDTTGNELSSDGSGSLRTNPYGPSGSFKVYTIGATAGNVIAQISVPAGKKWIVVSAQVLLTTNGTAGNRTPQMFASDSSSNFVAGAQAGTTQPASTANCTYTFAPSLPTSAGALGGGGAATIGFPTVYLPAAGLLWFLIAGGLAGDSFTVRGINVIELPN